MSYKCLTIVLKLFDIYPISDMLGESKPVTGATTMINPNICKRITVTALPVDRTRQFVVYKGYQLEVNDLRHGFVKPGSRYVWLKYSITSDSYYVTRLAY